MYIVTGATGNTGKPLALALLGAGKKVRIISRNAEKARELTAKGAELILGDHADPAVCMKAFQGATAVYAMIPVDWAVPDYFGYQKRYIDALTGAMEKSGVQYVVSLSSVGTHLEKESGVVFGLRHMEQRFNAVKGLQTLHLRPTYFMENTFGMMGVIKAMGVMGSPVRSDLRMNMIATKDIAAYAAKRLLALDFRGHNIQYLLGQRDLTYSDVASIFGKAMGINDLKYVEFSYDDFTKALMGMGASKSLSDSMNEFIRALNAGKVLQDAQRTPESTTPTSIEEFAKTFAYVYNKNS